MLLALVNSPRYICNSDTITLKYFIKGHTYMSADACHARVEQAFKRKKFVFTEDDLAECISGASAATRTIVIKHTDILRMPGGAKSREAAPREKIADLSVIQFRRGEKVAFAKTSFTAQFQEFDFLTDFRKATLPKPHQLPQLYEEQRGVSAQVMNDIRATALPIIRAYAGGRYAEYADWFEELPVSNTAADLRVADDFDAIAADIVNG